MSLQHIFQENGRKIMRVWYKMQIAEGAMNFYRAARQSLSKNNNIRLAIIPLHSQLPTSTAATSLHLILHHIRLKLWVSWGASNISSTFSRLQGTSTSQNRNRSSAGSWKSEVKNQNSAMKIDHRACLTMNHQTALVQFFFKNKASNRHLPQSTAHCTSCKSHEPSSCIQPEEQQHQPLPARHHSVRGRYSSSVCCSQKCVAFNRARWLSQASWISRWEANYGCTLVIFANSCVS